jgi:hypothetical protein
MTYQTNSQSEFTWNVYSRQGNFIGQVVTTRKSEGAAKLAAREEWGPDSYTVELV